MGTAAFHLSGGEDPSVLDPLVAKLRDTALIIVFPDGRQTDAFVTGVVFAPNGDVAITFKG